ncbi:MAG: inositol monophosphatase family protein [Aestuariivirga sp.]
MQDAELLINAVRRAGDMALSMHAHGFDVEHKADGSKVTSVDIAVDKFLHNTLLPLRSDYGWLSEEQPDDGSRLVCEKFFIVDPIDGTSAFASGHEHWCVAAGIVDDAGVAACTLYQPRTSRLFHATRGTGSWLNGTKLTCADDNTLDGARLLATGRTRHALEPAVMARTTSLPLLMRFAALAANEGDIALSLGPRNDWDIAPGVLLVQEAGGIATQANGAPFNFKSPVAKQNGILVAGARRHGLVLRILETT